jgi:hypothetical protein
MAVLCPSDVRLRCSSIPQWRWTQRRRAGVDGDGEGVLCMLDWVLTRGGGAAGNDPSTGELWVDLECLIHCVIKQTKSFRECASEGKEEGSQRGSAGYSTTPKSE